MILEVILNYILPAGVSISGKLTPGEREDNKWSVNSVFTLITLSFIGCV